jgi:hypothetical protein
VDRPESKEVAYQRSPINPKGIAMSEVITSVAIPNQSALARFSEQAGEWRMITWNVNTPEGLDLLFRAQQEDTEKLIGLHGKTVKLVNIYAAPYVAPNKETGELQDKVRIVLIDSDGELYSSSAIGVGKSLAALAALEVQPPYNPPLEILISAAPNGNGRMWVQFRPTLEAIKRLMTPLPQHKKK